MNVKALIHHPRTKKVAIGVGVVIGVMGVAYGVGYVIGRREEKKELSQSEVDELERIRFDVDELRAKRETKVVIDEDDLDHAGKGLKAISDAAKDVGKAFVEEHKNKPVEEVIEVKGHEAEESSEELVRQNVFARTTVEDDVWVLEEEMKSRDSSEPYIIHKDEFFAEEMGFAQHTLTYYNGDDILADEEDKPMYNYPQVVGGELKFGHGSGDPKIVYVRNEARRVEYEIMFEPGLFSVEVLGLNVEERDIEHSAVRKFRPE